MQLTLQVKAKQQLSLSPQLQEAIRFMQLSAMELRAEIALLAQDNPLLEIDQDNAEADEVDKAFFNSRQFTSQSEQIAHFPDDNIRDEEHSESLRDLLLLQLDQHSLSPKDEIIGLAIIDAINPNGYLALDGAEIMTNLNSQNLSVNQQEIEKVLTLIQAFSPSGVGARDLKECLLLQLQQRHAQTAVVKQAAKIVTEFLPFLLTHDVVKLQKKSGFKREECEQALRLIQSLNPHPGAHYVPVVQNYCVPDVIVHKVRGEWKIEINEQLLPRVKINHHYLNLLDQSKEGHDSEYRRQRLHEAKWLMNSIANRQQTLTLVAQEIVKHQRNFLEYGPMALCPMKLENIATAIDRHESTVSRITTQKFILTPHGLFELKYFFSNQISTENGIGASSTAIRSLIKRLVKEENRHKPHSDNALCHLMKAQGIMIARRTITKYREALGILSSVDRRVRRVRGQI